GSLAAPPNLFQPATAMPAAEGRDRAIGILDALDQEIDAIAAPNQFAVEYHGRHAEPAERLRLVDDAIMLGAAGPLGIGFEIPGGTAGRCDHTPDITERVDFQIVAPESREYRVVVWPEEAVALRKQHACTGVIGIIDLARPL